MSFDHRTWAHTSVPRTGAVKGWIGSLARTYQPRSTACAWQAVLRVLRMLAAIELLTVGGPAAAQTILTVGPDGTYATLGSAASQIVDGGDFEIRIEEGDHWGGVGLISPGSFTSGSVLVSGGWGPTFSTRRPDPGATRLHDGRMGIAIQGGSFRVENLTSRGSSATMDGLAIHLRLSGTALVQLDRLRIVDNHMTGAAIGDLHGGGIYADLIDSSRLEVTYCEVSGNGMNPSFGEATFGGGIYLSTDDTSTVLLERNWIEHNSCASSVSGRYGGGLFVISRGFSGIELVDCEVRGNTLGSGTGSSEGSGAFITTTLEGQVVVRRLAWISNTDTGISTAAQVHINVASDASIEVTDSMVCSGDDTGLQAYSLGVLRLTNLTVADNAGDGVKISATTGDASLSNTITTFNGVDTNFIGVVTTANNLVGADPIFDDPVG